MAADQHYQDTREALTAALDDFKQLEKDEPDVASRLGFAGYVQYQTVLNLGARQVQLLEKIESSRLYWIESYAQDTKEALQDDILPLLKTLANS